MNNLQFYSPENSTIPYHNLLTGSSRGYSGEFFGDLQQLRRVHFISLQGGFYDSLGWLCKDPCKRSKGKFPFKLIILGNVICKRPLEANVL